MMTALLIGTAIAVLGILDAIWRALNIVWST
jgi:hypothetical protein